MSDKGKRFFDKVEKIPDFPDLPSVMASSSYTVEGPLHDPISNVLQFHTTFKCRIGEKQEIPEGPHDLELEQLYNHLMELRTFSRNLAKADYRHSRMALNLEELAEKCKAYKERDPKALLDAGGDMDYINVGDMIGVGLHGVFYEACDRIHESNMSKTDEDGNPVYDEAGKVIKGPNYKAVDLSDLIDN